MRRIFVLLAISLTAVMLVTVLTGGAASAGTSHSANNNDDSSHVFSSALVPDLGPTVEPTIGGIAPGGLPWVLDDGHATLTKRGRLEASVEGLLLGPGAPANLVGTTGPITQVFASVVCANGPVISTNAVTFSKDGDAHINQQVALPAQCVGPVVLIRASLGSGPWLAASGL
jgi:hypothetical protein